MCIRLLLGMIFSFCVLILLGASESNSFDRKPPQAVLHKVLTPLQYNVTQEEGTEEPFKNAYWNNHEAGIYVDVVSGEPLFSSLDKYDSQTGWPSFWKPLVKDNIGERLDLSIILEPRTEVHSKHGNSHLGHVFNDGPQPTGLRYCINSAALKFIPVTQLQAAGYGGFLPLFQKATPTTVVTNPHNNLQTVVFAGGCFWGVQAVFEHVKGVVSVTAGYTGGSVKNPSYELVSTGTTGHAESVEVEFDPAKVSFDTLLKIFFIAAHDPTQLDQQGPDVGTQYRSAIFYTNAEQKQEIEAEINSLSVAKSFDKPIVTQVIGLKDFYPAEEYHQDFVDKHPDQVYVKEYDEPKLTILHQKFSKNWTDQAVHTHHHA